MLNKSSIERRPGSARPTTYLPDNILYIFDGYGSTYGPWPDHWVPGATFGRNIGVATELEALWTRRKVTALFIQKLNARCILSNARVEEVQACELRYFSCSQQNIHDATGQKCGSAHEEILFSQNSAYFNIEKPDLLWSNTKVRLELGTNTYTYRRATLILSG